MSDKPQWPMFDPAKLKLPSDIRDVIKRLIARGLIKINNAPKHVDYTRLGKTAKTPCEYCGKPYSRTYDRHICKAKRPSLPHIN